MDLGLTGRKAVLVGASHGIGLATAHVLAAEGCDLAICSRSQASVDAAIKSLAGHGRRVVGAAVDVTNADVHSSWIAKAAEDLGGCDIFISFTSNNGPDNEEGWTAVFNADTLAVVRGVRAILPTLAKSDAGSIVMIASTAAVEDFMGGGPMNGLKAALINYSAALSQRLAPQGIRVNCVTPGPILIEGRSWDLLKDSMPDFVASTISKIPMGRMGSGEEVGRAIAFTASPACRYMTGANIVVDGGFTKRVQF
jgi:3-oxoacyl-[acyl-carrier protein] reductase